VADGIVGWEERVEKRSMPASQAFRRQTGLPLEALGGDIEQYCRCLLVDGSDGFRVRQPWGAVEATFGWRWLRKPLAPAGRLFATGLTEIRDPR
jgi:hypothetical protein